MYHNFIRNFSKMRLIEKVINPTSNKHNGTIIFLHGSGDTGNNLIEWIKFLLGKNMEFGHLKIIFPTAPIQPYTPMDGENSNVWFDRKSISIEAKESRSSLASIYETMNELLKREMTLVPANRIILGGFSMGGALAMHTVFHLNRNLRGVFACSSFLNQGSIVYDSLSEKKDGDNVPELLMFHGDRDSMVPLEWGERTFNELLKLGVKGEFVPLKNTLHELKKKEMEHVISWIEALLPDVDGTIKNKL